MWNTFCSKFKGFLSYCYFIYDTIISDNIYLGKWLLLFQIIFILKMAAIVSDNNYLGNWLLLLFQKLFILENGCYYFRLYFWDNLILTWPSMGVYFFEKSLSFHWVVDRYWVLDGHWVWVLDGCWVFDGHWDLDGHWV